MLLKFLSGKRFKCPNGLSVFSLPLPPSLLFSFLPDSAYKSAPPTSGPSATLTLEGSRSRELLQGLHVIGQKTKITIEPFTEKFCWPMHRTMGEPVYLRHGDRICPIFVTGQWGDQAWCLRNRGMAYPSTVKHQHCLSSFWVSVFVPCGMEGWLHRFRRCQDVFSSACYHCPQPDHDPTEGFLYWVSHLWVWGSPS